MIFDNTKVAINDDPYQWNVSGNTVTPTDSAARGAGFQFDHIFDMQKKNTDIFNTVVKPTVNSTVNGFNGTVLAYGQTGSGKTYTMMGTENQNGIIPQAINYMFKAIESKEGHEFLIRFSYFEIYNEIINDLMEVENTDLKIKEENGRVFVNKCSEKITKGPNHMLTAMRLGEKNRRIGETNMNEQSSRSHTVFRITIESREISSDSDSAIQIAQLNLVDLAGSERASQTGATGDRFKEGKHIILSLSTLGLVIKQLSETQDKDKPNFVNFWDCNLTRILQASLGGNSLIAIICTVTPATFKETYCTLSFASRAKSVKNKPKNEDLSEEALLKRYKKQIILLTNELEVYNSLQADFEKYSESDMQGINISEENERILVSIKYKVMELQSKMKQEKEEYNKKLGELQHTLKTLETENLDLKSNVDGYEANEKQLKNIIDIQNNEILKNNQKIKDLQTELEQFVEANNKLSEENLKKNYCVEEISSLLKDKRDKKLEETFEELRELKEKNEELDREAEELISETSVDSEDSFIVFETENDSGVA